MKPAHQPDGSSTEHKKEKWEKNKRDEGIKKINIYKKRENEVQWDGPAKIITRKIVAEVIMSSVCRRGYIWNVLQKGMEIRIRGEETE